MSAHPDAMAGWSDRDTSEYCPTCEHPISDENPIARMPASLENIKPDDIPPRFRGVGNWLQAGCQSCIGEDILEIAKHWLGQGVGSMEDVADLIAEHLGYKLVPVTA